jgi:hypothetical protein
MEPLFNEEPPEEVLAGLERESVRLLEDLAEVAKAQKALVSEVRRVERERKKALSGVEEHSVPEDQDLTLEDVEKWCRSAFFNMAHTAPGNPHCYFARKKVRDPIMYERVVGYVLANGYPQKYGNATYTALDVELNGSRWFLWPMTDDPKQSEVLNLKPDSMRPDL